MLLYLRTSLRDLLVALALALALSATSATATATANPASARTTAPTKTDAAHDRDEFPLEGALIIIGIVGVVIVIAWVCSRVGDTRSPLP
jgi:hypothetical protein